MVNTAICLTCSGWRQLQLGGAQVISTPLHLPAWQRALAAHLDSTFASYILNGIAKGFHIGADRAVHLVPGHRNMLSVQQQPQLVASQIREETVAGRVLGPLPPHLANLTQTSPIGLIPKPHQPGKWRLIVDLSSPAGQQLWGHPNPGRLEGSVTALDHILDRLVAPAPGNHLGSAAGGLLLLHEVSRQGHLLRLRKFLPPISSQMGGLCQYTHTRPSASPIDGDHRDGPVLSGRRAAGPPLQEVCQPQDA